MSGREVPDEELFGPAPARTPKRPRTAAPPRTRPLLPARVPPGHFGRGQALPSRPRKAHAPTLRPAGSALLPPARLTVPERVSPGFFGLPRDARKRDHGASTGDIAGSRKGGASAAASAREGLQPEQAALLSTPKVKAHGCRKLAASGHSDEARGGSRHARACSSDCVVAEESPKPQISRKQKKPVTTRKRLPEPFAAPRTKAEVDAKWDELPWRIGRAHADLERNLSNGAPRLTEICFRGMRRMAATGQLGSLEVLTDDVAVRVLRGASEESLVKLEAENPDRAPVLDACWTALSGAEELEPGVRRWRELVERKHEETKRALDAASLRLRERYSQQRAIASRRVVSSSEPVAWAGVERASRRGTSSTPPTALGRIRKQVKKERTLTAIRRRAHDGGGG